MEKILFLTRSYPNTLGSATLLCMHRVLNCVATSGKYEVHALCMSYPFEAYEEQVGNVMVHRFNPTWWQQMRNNLQSSHNHRRLARLMEIMTKLLTIPTFPRTEPLTDMKFTKEAMQLQRNYNYDLVVSEHHGLETLLTGCRLMSEFPKLKHIAVLWDPVKGQMATMKLPKSYTEKRIDQIENFATKYTTLLISTLSMKPYYEEYGDIAANHRIYLDIPGILKPEEEVTTEYIKLIKKDSINIVFSGLLSEHYRDARPIIRLLNQCDDAERINLIFFSRGEKDAIETEKKNFKGTIVYHDYIPLSELHSLYRHADYLLNVSHINANMVPSKIFEYMSYGKPIISTFISDGDSARKYINRYPEGICIELKKSEKDNVDVLNAFMKKKHKLVTFDFVREEFKENTPGSFLREIEKVLENEGNPALDNG